MKMSDDEIDEFKITNYDFDNKFDINKSQRRMTKNQAIYGNIY